MSSQSLSLFVLFHFRSHSDWVSVHNIQTQESGFLCLDIMERFLLCVSPPHVRTWFLIQFGQLNLLFTKYQVNPQIVFTLSIYLIRNTPTIFSHCKIQSEFLFLFPTCFLGNGWFGRRVHTIQYGEGADDFGEVVKENEKKEYLSFLWIVIMLEAPSQMAQNMTIPTEANFKHLIDAFCRTPIGPT